MKNLNRASILLLALGMSYRTEAVEGATGAAAAPEVPAVPAVPEVKPLTAAQQKKADAKAAKDKEKADKAAAAAEAAKNAPAPVAADTKNGVTRPGSGKTKQVWDVADAMSKELKAPVDRKALTDKLLDDGLVVGTIHTQYGKWRKYHGLVTVKEPKAAAPAATEVPAVPAAPEVPAAPAA